MNQIDYQALNDRLYRAFLDNVKDADPANDIAQLRELVGEIAALKRENEELRELIANTDCAECGSTVGEHYVVSKSRVTYCSPECRDVTDGDDDSE